MRNFNKNFKSFKKNENTLVFDKICKLSCGIYVIKYNDKYGFMDENCNIIVEPEYDSMGNFSEGLAIMKNKDGLYGVINKNSKVVVEPKYDYICSFSEGLAGFEVNNKCGFIDQVGRVVIEPKYNNVGSFKNGYASFEINKKWGLIDICDKVFIEPKYDDIGDFLKNKVCVKNNGKMFFIYKTEPFDYDKALLDAQKELDELYPDCNNEESEELKEVCSVQDYKKRFFMAIRAFWDRMDRNTVLILSHSDACKFFFLFCLLAFSLIAFFYCNV